MKVAVVLFGHMRTYKQTGTSLKKNLLIPFDADLYVHTWEELERTTESHQGSDSIFSGKKISKTEIVNCYGEAEIRLESQSASVDTRTDFFGTKSTAGINSMLLSISNGAKMVLESSTQYDLVIFTRPDIMLRCSPDLRGLNDKINSYPYPSYYYSGYFVDAKNADISYLRSWGASDCFFILGRKSISLIADYKDNDKTLSYPYDVWGEDHFRYFMHDRGVIGVPFNYIAPKDWGIKRSNNEHTRLFVDLALYVRKAILAFIDGVKLVIRRAIRL